MALEFLCQLFYLSKFHISLFHTIYTIQMFSSFKFSLKVNWSFKYIAKLSFFPILDFPCLNSFPPSQTSLHSNYQKMPSFLFCVTIATFLYCSQTFKRAHFPSRNSSVLILFLLAKVICGFSLTHLWGHCTL